VTERTAPLEVELTTGRSSARRPARVRIRQIGGASLVLALLVIVVVAKGPHAVGQASVDGIVSGSYYALGAVGLTLIYGTLRLINFAHGDMLTFGAYIAYVFNVSLGLPIVVAFVGAVLATALLGLGFERIIWGPMRARRAGVLQLFLIGLGLAFVLRNALLFVFGSSARSLRVNVTNTVQVAGLRIADAQLAAVIVSAVILVAVGLALKATSLGRQIRALADNPSLAETTGIDSKRIITITWLLAGGLAGIAGVVLAESLGQMTPDLGFLILLSLFAAAVLGGIGSAYGALAGGVLLGLAQEWATMFVDSRWKLAVGFVVLILVLLVRPTGVLGRAGRTS
jgi:neutral amino acid transport system permease protein